MGIAAKLDSWLKEKSSIDVMTCFDETEKATRLQATLPFPLFPALRYPKQFYVDPHTYHMAGFVFLLYTGLFCFYHND